MNKIKEQLIKLLGGVTKDEHKKWIEYKYIHGKLFAIESIRCEMRCCYGMSPEKWCEHMYNCVEKLLKEYNDLYNYHAKRL